MMNPDDQMDQFHNSSFLTAIKLVDVNKIGQGQSSENKGI